MNQIFYLSIPKFPLKYVSAALITVLIFTGFRASAQHRHDSWSHFGGGGGGGSVTYEGYALTLNADYDAPVSDLGQSFRAAPAITVGVSHYLGDFTVSLNLGYHSYKPKVDTFFFDDGSGNLGNVSYQNFSVFSFYSSAVYNVDLGGGLRLYGGFNLGAYYVHYAYVSNDQFSNSDVDLSEQDVYIAPKFGFTYMVDNNFGFGLEGKYNIFTPAGNSNDNPNVGQVYKSYAVGLTLTYKLGGN